MTECERILTSGRFPADFLKEEIRCDFLVTEERKKIWLVELDLLMEFDAVCQKYGLKYYMIGGSLLGTIRHEGIIPWDDDIDVGMMRDDYEKLMKIGKDEFKTPYFLQTPYTDPGYAFSFAKLRNSNTTAVSEAFRYSKFNQGIFLDIFPLDNCRYEDACERSQMINALNMDNSTYMRMSNPHPSEVEKQRIADHSGKDSVMVYEEIQNIARCYSKEYTEYVNIAVLTMFDYKKLMWRRACFDKTEYKKFEHITVPVGYLYDELLTVQFGDYMKFPPVEQRGTWHASGIFEPNIAYSDFLADNWKEVKGG